MTEPTTPTARRLAEFDDLWSEWRDDILAIEAEAKAQERERIFRLHLAGWHGVNTNADRYTYTACSMCTAFEEPTDD